MHRVNILFLATFPFTGAGGVGRVTEALTAEFQSRGHGCTWLATRRGESQLVGDTPQLFTPSDVISSRANVEYLRRLIQERRMDMVVNQAGPNPQILDLIRPVAAKCRVFTVHHNCVACLQEYYSSIIDHSLDTLRVPRFLRWRPLYALLKHRSRRRNGEAYERVVREHARLVLLSDRFILELEVFSRKIDHRKVIAIPNPAPFQADPSALCGKENALLYVGRLANEQKRVDRLLEIWRRIAPDFPGWRLEIVGDGHDRGALEESARNMKLERIRFHGRQDPVPFYRKARFLLMTSDFEGYGMVLVEAQAFGCVPIAFRSFASIGEIAADGESGYLVEPADIEQFAEILSRAMRDPDRTAALASKCLENSEKFSIRTIADQWESAFSKAV